MAVSIAQYVDLLFKKLQGVAKTANSIVKGASNENIASPAFLRGDVVWMQANQVPATAQTVGNITLALTGANAVQCAPDTTVPPIGGVRPTWLTGETYWIPQEFGATWLPKVYVGPSGAANIEATGTQIFAAGIGGVGEYYFDTQAGVLNFIGETIPSVLTAGNVVYVAGYQYVGGLGVTNIPSGANIGNLQVNGNTITATTGNVVNIGNALSVAGNVTAPTFIGNLIGNITGNIDAGGANTEIQFNDDNVLAGSPGFTFDKTANLVTIVGNINVGNVSSQGNISAVGGIIGASLDITGNAVINGDLEVNGNVTYINVTNLNVEDPIIGLGRGPNNTPLTANDGKDRGEQLWYFDTNGNVEKSAFTGYDNSTGKIILATDVTIANEIVTVNNFGTLQTGNIELVELSATGNVTGGNIIFGSGIVSGTGNIYANKIFANIVGNIDAAGSNTEIQFNDGDLLAGSPGFTFDKTANLVTITGNIDIGNVISQGIVSANTGIYGDIYTSSIDSADSSAVIITPDVVMLAGLNVNQDITIGNIVLPSYGNITVGNVRIANLATPLFDQDAVTKQYVDSAIGNVLPIITNQTIDPDGSSLTYTLDQSTTAVGILVVINGITQTPNDSYLVTGNQITFSEVLITTDVVQVRFLSGTSTGGGATGATGATGPTGAFSGNLTANIDGQGFNISNVATISTTGNITGNYILGNGGDLTNLPPPTVAQDITSVGDMSIMTYDGNLKYVSYATIEPVSGNIKSAGNISATGNITAQNFVGNGAALTNVVTKFVGTILVPTGNSTQSFTVDPDHTYQLWLDCNIPNGILVWNAEATITNTNVPVVGAQYAWVYNGGGTPIDFTSIPNQFVGTANTIVRSSVSPSATSNRFDFGINNTSGNSQTIRYGWTRIS